MRPSSPLLVLLMARRRCAARADTIVFRKRDRYLADGARRERPDAADRRRTPLRVAVGRRRRHDRRLRRDRPAVAHVARRRRARPADPDGGHDATEDVPAETPTHVRISPDGARIAYDQVIDGDPTTLWTPASATGLDFPGQTDGQALPGRAVVDRQRRAAAEQGRRRAGAGRDVLALRDRRRRRDRGAVVQRRRGDLGDGVRRGGLALRDADRGARGRRRRQRRARRSGSCCGSSPPTRPARPRRSAASSALDARRDTYSSASPTFSPDGTRLAWAESDGIHVATLGALTDCAAIREQVVTLPGAWEPYWTPATPATPAPARRAGRR